jgi:hypothetical protein
MSSSEQDYVAGCARKRQGVRTSRRLSWLGTEREFEEGARGAGVSTCQRPGGGGSPPLGGLDASAIMPANLDSSSRSLYAASSDIAPSFLSFFLSFLSLSLPVPPLPEPAETCSNRIHPPQRAGTMRCEWHCAHRMRVRLSESSAGLRRRERPERTRNAFARGLRSSTHDAPKRLPVYVRAWLCEQRCGRGERIIVLCGSVGCAHAVRLCAGGQQAGATHHPNSRCCLLWGWREQPGGGWC